jgi:hypothetical protein
MTWPRAGRRKGSAASSCSSPSRTPRVLFLAFADRSEPAERSRGGRNDGGAGGCPRGRGPRGLFKALLRSRALLPPPTGLGLVLGPRHLPRLAALWPVPAPAVLRASGTLAVPFEALLTVLRATLVDVADGSSVGALRRARQVPSCTLSLSTVFVSCHYYPLPSLSPRGRVLPMQCMYREACCNGALRAVAAAGPRPASLPRVLRRGSSPTARLDRPAPPAVRAATPRPIRKSPTRRPAARDPCR